MSKTLPKISRKSRPTVRAARAKKTEKALIFSKADMARQYKAALRYLAVQTVHVGDPKVSETGILQKRHDIEV
jgi:hypothetical protein